MPKKKKNQKTLSKKNKKTKKKLPIARPKKNRARKVTEKKPIITAEKQEVWRKNLILAGIVCLLVLVNAIFFIRNRQFRTAPPQNLNSNQTTGIQPASTTNQPETEEEEANDKIIQELLAEKEQESWKTYRNKAYGFEIKYPQEWPDPAVSGPQEGLKFRNKITWRETGEPDQANGLDIYIYRNTQPSSKILKADYSDNLALKDTAAEDYSNCNTLEVFSIGEEEYPAVQVYNRPGDPCFKESYYLSLKKGFYIYDIVPHLKSGINYDGYDGEKEVKEEFSLFYRVVATLNFPINKPAVANTTTTTPKPKVEAPRVSKGRRCPEKNPHPTKSKTKGKHRDEDCCPDPDEWPMPGCAYSAHDYSIMLKTPSH